MGPAVWAMFIVWIAYGIWQWRRAQFWLAKANRVPRERRSAQATLWLLGGAAFLLIVLLAINGAGGFPSGGIAGWAWPLCALAGVGFVHSQVSAGTLLVSVAVTPARSQPSHSEKEGTPS